MQKSPTDSQRVTSPFGKRIHPITGKTTMHNGVDIGRLKTNGEPIYSTDDGKVLKAYYNSARGYVVEIQHDTYVSRYQHLVSDKVVKDGQKVNAGDIIGYMGNSGASAGFHLHFEILQNNIPLDPLPFLKEVWNRKEKEQEGNTMAEPRKYTAQEIKESKEFVQKCTNFEDKTIQYIADDYRHGDGCIVRIAEAIKKGGK